MAKTRFRLTRRRIRLYLAGLPGAVLLLLAGAIAIDGLTDELARADVALVLGNKVEANGQPSDRLRARLDKGVELYERGMFSQVIVSGGIDGNGTDEAQAMQAYLLAQGIPEQAVLMDNGGFNTFRSARTAARLMASHDWQSILVVSQFFHITRARFTLRRFGVSQIYAAHADYFAPRDVYSTIREVVALGYYAVRSYQ